MSKAAKTNIITIGASAGGIPAVSQLLSGLKTSFNAAVFVVIHIPRDAMSEIILRQLQRNTDLTCITPADGETIRPGNVYLAPANHHIMLAEGKILVRKGPYENHWRPSIDVLFRTAAAEYSKCVIGIILTGLMDDGTSGMIAIKKSGGTLIVQDPDEALFPDMPESVLRNVPVDFKVPINEMAYIIEDQYARANCETIEVPKEVQLEADITLRMSSNIEDVKMFAQLSEFTCPDCGGILSKITGEHLPRYRCFTGHSYTERTLAEEQVKGIEESVWTAIRMMEERRNLLTSMENYDTTSKKERADQMKIHIDRLKSILLEVSSNNDNLK